MKNNKLNMIEAAKYLGITRKQLYNFRSRHLGPECSKEGNKAFFTIKDLDKWRKERGDGIFKTTRGKPKRLGSARRVPGDTLIFKIDKEPDNWDSEEGTTRSYNFSHIPQFIDAIHVDLNTPWWRIDKRLGVFKRCILNIIEILAFLKSEIINIKRGQK